MVLDVDELLNKVDGMQHNFHIAVRASQLLDDFDVDIEELSKVISADQALVTQLLKLCNSAEYGFHKKIVSINDAISKLGFKTLKSLVFAILAKGSLNKKIVGYDMEKGELWKNSITCAVYAKYLAEITKYKDPDLAFTAALLRDLGKLIIHEYIKPKYKKIVKLVEGDTISFYEAEQKILGCNHSGLGAKLAHKWNFPSILIDTIEYHHDPLKAEGKCEDIKLVSIVHVADSLTMMLGAGLGSDGMMYSMNVKVLENLGLDPSMAGIENLISNMVDLNGQINSLIANIG